MTERWNQYFASKGAFGREWLSNAVAHWSFSERLHGKITRYLPHNGRVLDIGCGPGYSDLWLASKGYNVVGVDSDHGLVDLARRCSDRLGLEAAFHVGDAFDLKDYHGSFDLAYSVGVLEHFDRDVTVSLLREQARCAKYVLIAIPTPWTRYAAKVTDERFYSVMQLRSMVSDAGMEPIAAFGYGDLCATTAQLALYYALPRAFLRAIQNFGFAYTIAVVGKTSLGKLHTHPAR
jgi:SAM-dependent methyltransferase